jgi:hypothetical protein
VLNGRLRIDEQPTTMLEVTVSSDVGSLNGRVLNSRQEPAQELRLFFYRKWNIDCRERISIASPAQITWDSCHGVAAAWRVSRVRV